MKISVLQENFLKGLSIVTRALASHSVLPILSQVLLATEGSRLKLVVTDLELSILCWIGAKVEDEGQTAVPARTLLDLVNALPSDRIDLDLADKTQTLKIACGRFTNNVKGVDAQEFPALPMAADGQSISVPADVLREAIDQTIFAAASDQSRPILTGVLLKFSGTTLTLTAADGFRLAVRSTPVPVTVTEPVEAIVPARALKELSRLLSEQIDPVSIAITRQHQIVFHLTNIDLISQLIDGNFPEVSQVIEQPIAATATLDTAPLLRACKAVNVFAREVSDIARLTFAPGTLKIGAPESQIGGNAVDLDMTLDGEPLEISFNVKYLIEALNAAGSRPISIGLVSPDRPCVIRPIADTTYTQVIMPMQTK